MNHAAELSRHLNDRTSEFQMNPSVFHVCIFAALCVAVTVIDRRSSMHLCTCLCIVTHDWLTQAQCKPKRSSDRNQSQDHSVSSLYMVVGHVLKRRHQFDNEVFRIIRTENRKFSWFTETMVMKRRKAPMRQRRILHLTSCSSLWSTHVDSSVVVHSLIHQPWHSPLFLIDTMCSASKLSLA